MYFSSVVNYVVDKCVPTCFSASTAISRICKLFPWNPDVFMFSGLEFRYPPWEYCHSWPFFLCFCWLPMRDRHKWRWICWLKNRPQWMKLHLGLSKQQGSKLMIAMLRLRLAKDVATCDNMFSLLTQMNNDIFLKEATGLSVSGGYVPTCTIWVKVSWTWNPFIARCSNPKHQGTWNMELFHLYQTFQTCLLGSYPYSIQMYPVYDRYQDLRWASPLQPNGGWVPRATWTVPVLLQGLI